MKKIIIDCDKNPRLPYYDWKIESHTKMGKLDWNKIKTELYLSEKQKSGYINGEDLCKELEDKNPLNANVLWYLLDHPELIPNEWKEKYVHFFGTILRFPRGYRFVLCLCFGGGGWRWYCYWLDGDFGAGNPSAVLASKNDLGTLDSLPSNKNLETLEKRVENIENILKKLKELL